MTRYTYLRRRQSAHEPLLTRVPPFPIQSNPFRQLIARHPCIRGSVFLPTHCIPILAKSKRERGCIGDFPGGRIASQVHTSI